jgi:hypothetical protein
MGGDQKDFGPGTRQDSSNGALCLKNVLEIFFTHIDTEETEWI